MATSKKKSCGTSSRSTTVNDPLLEQLKDIFAEYPEGVGTAHQFLLNPDGQPFLQINSGGNLWRVRPTVVDRHINGITDRVHLCTKNDR